MSTALVYASKHGSTADIARRIAEGLGPEPRLFDLADGQPDVSGFDTVVLGTAIYAGSPMPAMKSFAQTHGFNGQRVALFVGGMEGDPGKRRTETQSAFPPGLVGRAVALAFLGGRFQFARMKAPERFIIRRIAKVRTDVDAIDDAAITQFVATLQRA